ncbi:MAG: isoleucine--tRNA ligase [Alphaproteobacteria bacterium]|nr:isoleucine--tRNA ligase [Alphaproteobacteria bacterium]
MSDAKKADYRDTVFLPKTEFPMRGSLPAKEPELLARWRAMDLYGMLRAQSTGREKFILHDGPPYANGNIHLGHALNKILKDVVCRSHQMLGFDAPYVPGWDCHGLPIEWKIEEQYRAKGQDKDHVPVLQFRAECRAFAEHWQNVQSGEFQRLGTLGDWGHPYSTMTKKAEAQIVHEIHKFLLNGLLYKGVKPVMWSVVEKTALAEAEIEYHDHKSIAIWVKFPVVSAGGIFVRGNLSAEDNQEKIKRAPLLQDGVSVVIWTTTPWTIPGNRAIAYGDFAYSLIEVEEVAEGGLAKAGEKLVVMQDLLEPFCAAAKITKYRTVSKVSEADLVGTVCSHPFRGRAGSEGYFDYDVPLYHGDFVTTDTGTGFVHIAPGHGEDDFNLGQKYKIPFDETVGPDGRYLPNVKGFEGLYVYKPDGKAGEANGAIIKALIEAGALLAKASLTHSYPHSWRSKAPLIFRTTPQWFIALDREIDWASLRAPLVARSNPVQAQELDRHGLSPQAEKGLAMTDSHGTLRELALKAIEDTKWYPGVGKNRIHGMIDQRPDWCISRQRAWGVPIALFVSKKDNQPLKDPAVLERIGTAFEHEGADAWYARDPQEFLGNAYKAEDFDQVFDIVDVWFESGATHAFCLNQKLGSSEWPNLQWPASLYLEGSDQHRGWFHSSLLESCGTTGRAPYGAVLTHGFVLDEHGRKQSKSLGNVITPQEVTEKMGADILRLWVLASDFTQDLGLGPNILKQMGDLYRRFRNTLRYLLGALDGFSDAERLPESEMPELERWVLHRLSEMDAVIRGDIAKYDYNHMLQELHNFCAVDLSAFYFDIRKDSLYCDRPDSARRRAARTAMNLLFEYLVAWLAPVLCFTVEEAFLARHPGAEGSVHLLTYPDVPEAWRNEALGGKWEKIRDLRRVVTGAIEVMRNEKKIGSSLQAHVYAYLTDKQWDLLEGHELASVGICSALTLKEAMPPAEAFTLPDVPGFGVVVKLAAGAKCERCWQVLPEVEGKADVLCNRCRDAAEAGKKGMA